MMNQQRFLTASSCPVNLTNLHLICARAPYAHNTSRGPARVESPEWGNEKTLVVPCVVHWKENHYAAILARKNDSYEIIDSVFGNQPRWLKLTNIQEEASGYFIVRRDRIPEAWKALTTTETDEIFGRGWVSSVNDPTDSCGNGSGGGSPGGTGGRGGGGSGGFGGNCLGCGRSGAGGPGGAGSGGSTGGSGGSCSNCPSASGGGTGGNSGNGGGGTVPVYYSAGRLRGRSNIAPQ
jgi:hypothetical protein